MGLLFPHKKKEKYKIIIYSMYLYFYLYYLVYLCTNYFFMNYQLLQDLLDLVEKFEMSNENEAYRKILNN